MGISAHDVWQYSLANSFLSFTWILKVHSCIAENMYLTKWQHLSTFCHTEVKKDKYGTETLETINAKTKWPISHFLQDPGVLQVPGFIRCACPAILIVQ